MIESIPFQTEKLFGLVPFSFLVLGFVGMSLVCCVRVLTSFFVHLFESYFALQTISYCQKPSTQVTSPKL